MSGVKRSRIRLQMEKKACQAALSRIKALTGSIEGLREKVRTILGSISEGVQKSFPEEMQRVRAWQTKDFPEYSQKMTSIQLNGVVGELGNIHEGGREVLHLLIEIKEVRREARARELIGRLETFRTDLKGVETLLNQWNAGGYENLLNVLDRLAPMIDREEFVGMERELNRADVPPQ